MGAAGRSCNRDKTALRFFKLPHASSPTTIRMGQYLTSIQQFLQCQLTGAQVVYPDQTINQGHAGPD